MDNRNFLFMFYGFAVAWLIPMLYVLSLMSREKKLRQEMQRLKTMIETGDRR
ncbi:MAG: hypothetical protein H7039_01765 [Bryobacteraceae bacterium]|nr:hypothetical protein [Bryobacteraceae bacterium]